MSDYTYIVTQSGFQNTIDGTWTPETVDPLGGSIRDGCDGDSCQMGPGDFPRARGPWGGRNGCHIIGWDRSLGPTVIKRDEAVGSTDAFIVGQDDTNFVLERLNLECDDRAAFKTTSGVGPKHALIDVSMYGKGSPIDPLWKDNSKWGCHTYDLASFNQVRVRKWSIFHEHGDYHHNLHGAHNYVECVWGWMGGCAALYTNRKNEGAAGVGNVVFQDCYVEDVCIGQGGSAFTFRGGMPTSEVIFNRVKVRLGCHRRLAAPWNQRICGAISVDSADATTPGAGDEAWEGGTKALKIISSDIEVGTFYQGITGQIRPVVQVSAVKELVIQDSRIAVTRATGAYPMALAIGAGVESVKFVGNNQIGGWIDYQGTRFTSLDLFRGAHPECFG